MKRTLDMEDFFRLPLPVRQAVRDWLKAEGLGEKVFEITLTCAGIVTVGRYRLNDKGSRFYDHHFSQLAQRRAAAQEHILHAVRTPPPSEAFES